MGEHSCVKWPLKAKSVAPFDRALLVVCTVTRWSYICISTSIICFFLYLSLFDLCIQPRVFSSSYYSAMRCDWISRKQIICPVGCNKDGRFLLLVKHKRYAEVPVLCRFYSRSEHMPADVILMILEEVFLLWCSLYEWHFPSTAICDGWFWPTTSLPETTSGT